MKLTKAQRHIAYKKAYNIIKKEADSFICVELCDAINGYKKYRSATDAMFLFPEALAKKPIGAEFIWFKNILPNGKTDLLANQKQRLKLLRACIRETTPKKRKK